jgi:hypothetical protein
LPADSPGESLFGQTAIDWESIGQAEIASRLILDDIVFY